MIVVSVGCPASVGPEVSLAALRRLKTEGAVVVGSALAIRKAAELVGVSARRFEDYRGQDLQPGRLYVLDVGPALTERDLDPRRPTRAAGRSQLAAIDAAFDLVRKTRRAALVTGPVSKALIARSGAKGAESFKGHTEWLQARDGAPSSTMCFASPRITTSLASTHLPLSAVPNAVTVDLLITQARLLDQALRTDWRIATPRLGLCALNPHASDGGLFGDEERTVYQPALEALRGRGVDVHGPVPADTVFLRALRGEFDVVIAPYHDVGMAAFKTAAFGHGVNVTLGLPFIRTSPDHGTALDIAGAGLADPSSMLEAIALAERLVSASRAAAARS